VPPGDTFGELPDPLFRSSWEDAPDETEQSRLRRRTAPPDDTPLVEATALLAPAQDALARLAAEHAWLHPHDLALRNLLLTGGFDAAVRASVPAHALPNTTASGSADWDDSEDPLAPILDEAGVPPALRLTRLLRHLPRLRITPEAATQLLATLAEAGIVAEITGRKSCRAFGVTMPGLGGCATLHLGIGPSLGFADPCDSEPDNLGSVRN
jgi:hypothetical protein